MNGRPGDPTRPGGPRALVIMGSGEVAPTMAKVHRALFGRFGDEAAPAVIIDTPFGFQENADELSTRMVEFFATSVGRRVEVAAYRTREADGLAVATAVARIRQARYVMSGPGSPSYALRQWAGGPIPGLLAEKLSRGGILTMASAAALTVGVLTIPVYEIYKVGEDPRWLEGLDLLGAATGLRAAVVPHYDNAEGGTHDTRFCYMGERRLRLLERAMPDGAFILGVDGHTALVLDLERGTASVAGLGGVTVRVDGRSRVLPAGSVVPIDALEAAARQLADGGPTGLVDGKVREQSGGGVAGIAASLPAPLPDTVAVLEGTVIDALEHGDARAAVGALIDISSAIAGRLRAGEDSPDLDGATATFHALITRLGERAEEGVRDPRLAVEPFVAALLEVRSHARGQRDWASADMIRDRLAAAGVEIQDQSDGPAWSLSSQRRE